METYVPKKRVVLIAALTGMLLASGCSSAGSAPGQSSQSLLEVSRGCDAAGPKSNTPGFGGVAPGCVLRVARTLDKNVLDNMTYWASQTNQTTGSTTKVYRGIDPYLKKCEVLTYVYTPQIQSRQIAGPTYEIDIVGTTNNQCGQGSTAWYVGERKPKAPRANHGLTRGVLGYEARPRARF